MVWLRTAWESLRGWVAELLRANLTPREVGRAVGVGVFVGVLPIYGLHLPLCVLVARVLKLNQVITYAAAQVSNPVFAPFLVFAEIALGDWILFGTVADVEPPPGEVGLALVRDAPELFLACGVGSLVLGAVAAPLLGFLVSALVRWRRGRGP